MAQPVLPKVDPPLIVMMSATATMHPPLDVFPLKRSLSLFRYKAPLNVVVDPPLIWFTHEPFVEQPLRLPKNRIPLNEPVVGADKVALACPLMVMGV